MPPDTTPDSKSDTFTSVLPVVEDVLECVYNLAEGGDTTIDEVVTKQAREIQAQLNGMKAAATALPGGHISTQMIGELSNVFDAQTAERSL
ncbi:hypothetical protein A1Q2_05516 [Trichosporon asahii var. asahii CBS 8904]|uniref:Uncharacterized protein n=2 Tax=Trichosporon asahii var. asahii TaxID=189963 RepID=K1VU14_TRIAC|nr:hypothetical protein A1Q1_06052 [Trichosporon asahii var. asahii CBS 2479]EJT45501.1 hypothetical protein A1Q1_06052 [Trichosporon asahii var. asahii CBS 2479]EKD00173.1 hypothetical protein A1Q2_05516 [Trichosporon asahii var. asahii CBS 8904]